MESALTPAVTEVLGLFRVVFRSVRRHDRYIEEQCGIGAMQLRALAIVKARPGIGVTPLADALFVHQPTASKLVEGLVGLGLIGRGRSAGDGRVVQLEVTRAGDAILSKAPGPVLGILPDGLGSLGPTALRRLGDGLVDLLDAMQLRDDGARFEPLSDS